MPANLTGWVGARAQEPIAIVKINGTPIINPIAVDVTMGVEQQSSEATVRISAEDYPSWAINSTMEVRLGFGGINGGTRLVFVGMIQDTDTQFAPYTATLKAAGYLKKAQRNAGNTDPISEAGDPIITWNGATDSQIWNDLMKLAGVPSYASGDGDSRTITGPITLLPGDNIRSKIDDLDHASESGQRTFEYAGQVYRTPALRIPAGTPNWRYIEGAPTPAAMVETIPVWPLYSLQRQQTDRDVKNQVIVQGTQVAGTESADVVAAVRQSPSGYWGNDGNGQPIYVPFSFGPTDLLETRDQCDAVAQRYMYEHNKVTDIVQMRTPLNPFAMPSRTVGITSDRLGLRVQTNYWVRQVSHHWGTDGASTDWTLEGGAGDSGYLVGLPPIALFEMKVTKEFFQYGIYDTPTGFYTVACDASASHDPDGTAITYAWSTSTGASGTDVMFTTTFTQAQWDDTDNPPTITLTVTDSDVPDAHHATNGPVPAGDTGTSTGDSEAAKVIAMYVAALGAAYATGDGWETTNTWTPPASCISVGRIGAEGTNFFGLSNGGVYKTTDYLATAPTLVWTAPSAVNTIWMSELDTNIVAIGLQNGDFWLTKDSFLTTPILKRNFGNAIEWINGSSENKSQWRACVGQDVWITNYDWERGDYHVLVSFAGQVIRQTELGPFANYASASGSAGQPMLKREGDGYAYDFSAFLPQPAEVHMTNFIDRDSLLVGDDQGRSYLVTSDATVAPVAKTDIGYGAVHDMLRDNTNFAAAYAACDMALAKTYDTATTWVRVLTFNGTTTRGLRIGYDSAPLTPPVQLADQLIERVAMPYVVSSLDDSPQDNGTLVLMDMWNPALPANDPVPTNWYLRSFVPADYTPAGLTHHWETGEDGYINSPIGGAYEYYDRSYSGWVRSPITGTGIPSGYPHHTDCRWIMRHTFTIPNITLGRALLVAAVNSSSGTPHAIIEKLYINDTLILDGRDTPYSAYIDHSLLVSDGVTLNLIAMEMRVVTGTPAPRVAYKLAMGALSGAATENVALFEGNNGRLTWGSTSEAESGTFNDSLPAGWQDPIVGTIVPGGAFAGGPLADLHMGLYADPWPTVTSGKKFGNMCGVRDYDTFHVVKQAADFPAGTDTSWHLYIRKQSSDHTAIRDIYINGTRLSGPVPISPADDAGNNYTVKGSHDAHTYRFDVPSGLVVMGGRNTIAFSCFQADGFNDAFYGLAWYMEKQDT